MRRSFERFALGIGLVLAGCGAVGSSAVATTPRFVEDGVFTIALPADPGNLDPHHGATYAPVFLRPMAYEPLLARSSGRFLPILADLWTQTTTSVTYHVRAGVTCADGTPLTAADVADNFKYIANAANGSTLHGVAVPLGGKIDLDASAGTVTITVPEPNSFLLDMTGPVPMVCRAGLNDRSRLQRGTEGTGLFKLSEARPNDRYVYTRRSGYFWGPEGTTSETIGVPREVVFRVIGNQTTAANLLLAGQLTVAAVSGPDRLRLEAAGFRGVPNRGPAIQMWFNQTPQRATADPRVREALSMAVDVAMIAKVAGNRWSLLPRRLTGTDPMVCSSNTVAGMSPPHDPAAARQLLERAGWRTSADGIRVKDGRRLVLAMVYDRDIIDPGLGAAAAELAIAQWREVGAVVTARSLAGAMVGDVLFGSNDFDIDWVPIVVPFTSRMMKFTTGPKPPHGLNFPNIDLPQVDALAEQANRLAGEASCPIWDEVEREYLRSRAVVPIMDFDNALYVRDAQFWRNSLAIFTTSIRMLR